VSTGIMNKAFTYLYLGVSRLTIYRPGRVMTLRLPKGAMVGVVTLPSVRPDES